MNRTSQKESRNIRRRKEKEEIKKMKDLKAQWEKLPEEERKRIEGIDEILMKLRYLMIVNPNHIIDIVMKPKYDSSEPLPTPKTPKDAIFEEITDEEAEEIKRKQEVYKNEQSIREERRKKHVGQIFGETFYFEESGGEADDEQEEECHPSSNESKVAKRKIKIEELD